MNINRTFSTVSKKFTIVLVGMSVFAVGCMAIVLYETNNVRFSDDYTSEELHSVVANNSAVAKYLESEKDYEAHFITIAGLVQEQQKNDLGDALLLSVVPVVLLAAVLGFLASRYLLKPVKDAYESQERFLQDAAHELRNPLAAMSTAIENASIQKTISNEFVLTMKRQTKRLIRINEDLLFLERQSNANKIKMVNISELLEDVIEDLQPSISHKKLKLQTTIQADVSYKLDPNDFIKLTRNIIENAIKYSKDNKKLQIKLNKKGRHVIFEVRDQGIGIPETEVAAIGERFFRASNVQKIDGTGLGLAIVKKVVNVYGGSIHLTSQVNKGTSVVVKL